MKGIFWCCRFSQSTPLKRGWCFSSWEKISNKTILWHHYQSTIGLAKQMVWVSHWMVWKTQMNLANPIFYRHQGETVSHMDLALVYYARFRDILKTSLSSTTRFSTAHAMLFCVSPGIRQVPCLNLSKEWMMPGLNRSLSFSLPVPDGRIPHFMR